MSIRNGPRNSEKKMIDLKGGICRKFLTDQLLKGAFKVKATDIGKANRFRQKMFFLSAVALKQGVFFLPVPKMGPSPKFF